MILEQDLFERVLVDPAVAGRADEFWALSGYVSGSLVERHLEALVGVELAAKSGRTPRVVVTVGMTSRGVDYAEFQKLRQLAEAQRVQVDGADRPVEFECYFLPTTALDSHAKHYVWLRDGAPERAFVGSANYTNGGFAPPPLARRQRESLVEIAPDADFMTSFRVAREVAINCLDDTVFDDVTFVSQVRSRVKPITPTGRVVAPADNAITPENLPWVELSLLDSLGRMYRAGGINWGYLADGSLRSGRDGTEMYIHVGSHSDQDALLPPAGVGFLVEMDDGVAFTLVREGDGGKNLTSVGNKRLMGAYFRRRLGIEDGRLVGVDAFKEYGRTTVKAYKVADDRYYFDFSKP